MIKKCQNQLHTADQRIAPEKPQNTNSHVHQEDNKLVKQHTLSYPSRLQTPDFSFCHI